MKKLNELLFRLRALFRRGRLESEMQEEMRHHVEMSVREGAQDGMAPDDAYHAAQRKFGNVGAIQETARDGRGFAWLENAVSDIRYGVRVLLRAPGFALAAIVSLAIGVGANTAVFSIVNGVLLRPLPYPDAERLVTVWTENRRQGANRQTSAYANIADWRKTAQTLQDIAMYDPVSLVVTSGEPRRISGLLVSANLGTALRVQPRIGRMFTEEDAARSAPVAILSHAAWLKHHGGAEDTLGRKIQIDGRPIEIVGVMPEGFYFSDKNTEVWLPLAPPAANDGANVRGVGALRVIARLAPGIPLTQAQSELSAIAAALEREHPANRELGVQLVPLAEQLVGRDLRNALALLLAAVGAVLLIACSNVGNLMLARGLARQREFAMRISLGATRGRLVAQLLIENVVLCVVAAGLGLLLASLTVDAVRTLAPAGIPRLDEITVDLRMLGFALGLSLASVCVFGLLPALQCTRRDALSMLRNSSRDSSEAPRGRRLRNALVIAEFALAVMLFAGAGMLVRSFMNLMAVDPGYRTENLLVAPLRLPASRPAGDTIPFTAALIERIRVLPGVTGVAVSEEAMLGDRNARIIIVDGGAATDTAPLRLPLATEAVTAEYFRVMDVPLRTGRIFSDFDGPKAPLVALVNETLARQLWPTEDPVGRRFRLGPSPQLAWITVVGVVADQRRQKLDRAPIAQVFTPWAQSPSRGMNLLVRTAADPTGLTPALRAAVKSIDPSVPFEAITTVRQLLDRTVAPQRFHTQLLTTFAILALVLAGVGIFGLMHYSVARRTQEIGIRTALGATGGQIVRDVLVEGLKLAALGVAIGLAGAVVLFRMFSALLYETSAADPLSLLGAGVVLIAAAALACYLPARRASRIDPLIALRSE
ncbi:MAG: ABC transporter permease [Verrucomicrobiota bacterium]